MKVFILLIVILFSQTISAYPIIKPIGDNNDYLYVHLSALPIVDINISLKQGSISDGSKPGLTNLMLNTLMDSDINEKKLISYFENLGAKLSYTVNKETLSINIRSISDIGQIINLVNILNQALFTNKIDEVSFDLQKDKIMRSISESKKKVNLNPWKKITKLVLNTKNTVNIAIIGKYVELKDAYKSLDEALTHGGIDNNLKINLIRIESDKLKPGEIKNKLKDVSGILIPGGFGKRGTEGKIAAINFARKNNIPFLGICFGMQMAVIEFARNKLNIKNATSSEFGPSKASVVGLMSEWTKDGKLMKGTDKNLGGTMRLGSYEARLKKDTKVSKIYNSLKINERHRHRYEVNINYKEKFENKGMIFSGLSPDNKLPEIVELNDHPWFIGVQFHPEFKSRPLTPHPLFSSFIKAANTYSKK